jgi:hypothetical protein
MHKVLSFPRSHGFNPEQTYAMGQAYELVHGYIERAGLNGGDGDELCELVARRIIEKATSGETDPKTLADYAILHLKV